LHCSNSMAMMDGTPPEFHWLTVVFCPLFVYLFVRYAVGQVAQTLVYWISKNGPEPAAVEVAGYEWRYTFI